MTFTNQGNLFTHDIQMHFGCKICCCMDVFFSRYKHNDLKTSLHDVISTWSFICTRKPYLRGVWGCLQNMMMPGRLLQGRNYLMTFERLFIIMNILSISLLCLMMNHYVLNIKKNPALK